MFIHYRLNTRIEADAAVNSCRWKNNYFVDADSAYTGEEHEKIYKKKKVINKVNEKGYHNKPLTKEQKANNKEKSRTRARVEHIFGFVENSMNGSFVRNIGIARAKVKIGMMNLTYNICCCVQLKIAVSMG